MNCCKEETQVSDLATDKKLSAMAEVKRKGIIKNLYFLTGCANPYGVEGMVIKDGDVLTVHYCGELVFVWGRGDLKRYIYGDNWTSILANEVARIKSERKSDALAGIIQQAKNKTADRNYVTC